MAPLKNILGNLITCPNGHNNWVQRLSTSPDHALFSCFVCGAETKVTTGYALPNPNTDDLLRQIADLVAENKRLADKCDGLRETMQHIAVKVRQAAIQAEADMPEAFVQLLWDLGTDLIRMAEK